MRNKGTQEPVKTTKKRKRKRRGRHYIAGVYKAVKCVNAVHYRSNWERVVTLHLDADPTVLKFEYETLKIPYVFNIKTRKIRNYYPDFIVYYADGRRVIIEVKRNSALNNSLVLRKAVAAREWANKNGMEYVFWTESIIKPLLKIYKEQ
jgi:hypothetical protein